MSTKLRRNPTKNLVRDNKSGVWNARWREGGRLRTKSLGVKELPVARKLIGPFMARIDAERNGLLEKAAERSRVTWEQVVDAYRADTETYPDNPETANRYDSDLNRIGEFLAASGTSPEEITEQTVNAFVAECRLDELSTSSIKNALTAWNRATGAAVYANLIPAASAGPVRFFDRSRLKRDGAKARPPLGVDFERLLPEIERLVPRLLVFVKFLHRTGCRTGELLAARDDDLHRERDGLQLWLNRSTKRGKMRSILLNGAEELLPLLPSRGRLFADLPDNTKAVSSMWGQFWKDRRAEVEAAAMAEGRGLTVWEERRWRLHDLRHAFACEAILADADLLTLRDHLGHSSYKTTELYIDMLRELPVAQRRPLRLFWRGKRRAADTDGEQPEVTNSEAEVMIRGLGLRAAS